MIRRALALCAAFALADGARAQQIAPQLPQSEASKLRELFADALAGDAKARKQLLAAAKEWDAKFEHDSLVAALRKGPLLPKGEPKPRGKGKDAEKLERFGSVTTGFTFRAGKDTFRYAVDVPKGHDPLKPAPVLLDPGHGGGAQQDSKGKAGYLGYFRHRADAAGLGAALVVRTEIVEQIGADGVKGARPEDQVSAVFDACFADLCSRFAVDLDRVWVSGISQTGFWSWQLGLTRPDRFAGLAPMGAVTWGTNGYLPNLRNLAVWIAHGDQDAVCPVAQPRKTSADLEALGASVRYVEVAGGKHDYSTWARLDEGLAWLSQQPRRPYPSKLAFGLQTLSQPWCYWIRVDALAKEGSGKAGQRPSATLAAEIDGQQVRITSEGVEKLTLCLSRELIDLARPVEVLWNGGAKLEAIVERDFVRTVELALDKCDWRGTFEAALELKR